MKTIITQEIDGVEIVKGFSRLAVDPEATKKAAVEKLKTDAVIQEKDALMEQNKIIAQKLSDARMDYISKPSQSKQDNVEQIKHRADLHLEKMNLLSGKISKRYKELCKKYVQYFSPPKYEKKVTDEESDDLQKKAASLAPNHVLKTDGSIIHDFRGIKFYVKDGSDWNKGIIKKLNQGLPDGAKKLDELTQEERLEIADQEDIERIYKLTPAQRDAELKGKINLLMLNTNARIELEADGDEQKKQQIKDEYKNAKEKLESRYND